MSTENLETGPEAEPSIGELVQSMKCHLNLRRNASTPTVEEISNTSISKWGAMAHRNHFSKSMGDLTNLEKQKLHCRSVIFEDDLAGDLAEHTEIIARARNRFRELELKYPKIFKNSSRSSISSLSCTENKWKSCDQTMSQLPNMDPRHTETKCQRNNSLCLGQRSTAEEKMKDRKLSVPVNGHHALDSRVNHFPYRKKPPPLSMAMRSQNLDDSCDSAFDDRDVDREASFPNNDNSPPARSPNSSKYGRFLYPGDSLESDKDSGISTDRPFVPQTKSRRNYRPVRWADSEESSTNTGIDCSKSTSLSTLPRGGSLTHDGDESSSYSHTKKSSDRRGILKSAAYRNQGLKYGSLDSGDEDSSCYYRRQPFTRERGSHSLGHCRSVPRYLNREDTDSDAETVCSVHSEVILRSARDKYLSLYQLNSSRSQYSNHSITNERVYKSQSMPELAIPLSLLDHLAGFSGDSLPSMDKKRYKRKNKFSRRSGLYVVNDSPVSEKPRFLSNSNKKASRLSKKKLIKQSSLHITEHTKKWYDNCTAVSKPTAGQSLGRIVGISHDFGGMAYQMELNRPGNGLYGFFIQKGFKQYRRGVFISRLMDSVSAKFLAGLLSPGDEILEINGLNAQSKAISEVHDIMAHSDKLMLTVLPFLGRKDW